MRIAIVNDMPLAVEAMRRAVVVNPQNQIAWIARNGQDAVDKCAIDLPDLVLMDLIMPVMDGIESTRRIMAATPCAILIVTASVGSNAARVYEAMGHGALDAIDTPQLGLANVRETAGPLLAKIDSIGLMVRDGTAAAAVLAPASAPAPAAAPRQGAALVAVGASSGGPTALSIVLRSLPKDFPVAVIVVQHVDRRFAAGMADWLAQHSALPVRVAQEGDRPAVGGVLLAAGSGDHLTLKSAGQVGYAAEPADAAYRPSVDVFFRSVAQQWPGPAAGVLLTGMGKDGAAGLRALRDKGHHTIAQDRATSAVYGMPEAAAALDAAVDILPVGKIAPRLVEVLGRK